MTKTKKVAPKPEVIPTFEFTPEKKQAVHDLLAAHPKIVGMSNYGVIEIIDGRAKYFNQIKAGACHAHMSYWSGEDGYYADGDYYDESTKLSTAKDLVFYSLYYKGDKGCPEWQDFLTSEDSPYYERFLSRYEVCDRDFRNSLGAYVFPNMVYVPTQILFNFCIATRQEWDYDILDFGLKFKGVLENHPPRLAAFLALGYSYNPKHMTRHGGGGHGVLCGNPEDYYARWITGKPRITDNTYANNPRLRPASQTTWHLIEPKGDSDYFPLLPKPLIPPPVGTLTLDKLLERLEKIRELSEKDYSL
jgi:hypothetical protein